MSTRTGERRSEAIRKAARHFKVGEVVYLYSCDTGGLYGLLRGSFFIKGIKHQSDTGVSFLLHRTAQLPVGEYDYDTYMVEFARSHILTRLSGPTVSYIIQEGP